MKITLGKTIKKRYIETYLTPETTDYYLLQRDYLFLLPESGRPSKHVKSKYVSFDTEGKRYGNGKKYKSVGYKEKQYLFNLDLYLGDKHYYGKNESHIKRYIQLLLNRYKKVTILIHNAKYDLALNYGDNRLIDFFLKKPISFKSKAHRRITLYCKKKMLDKVIFLHFENKDSTYQLTILDTTNFFKESLKQLSKDFGNKTASKQEYDYTPEKWNKLLDKKGKELVQQDTELLYKFWIKFVEESTNDGASIGISAASTALKTFKKSYLKHFVWIPKITALEIFKAYHGGRVESYELGNVGLNVILDINSLYPFVMTKYKYSVYPLEHIVKPNESDIVEMHHNIENESFNYFVKCSYRFPPDYPRPILCSKNKHTGKLEFKLSGNGIITGNEYLLSLKEGCKFKITEIWKFKNEELFDEYVNHYYEKKATAKNQTEKDFSKLMLNSLYGKFAQHLGFEVWKPYGKTIEGKAAKSSFEAGLRFMESAKGKFKLYPDFYVSTSKGELIFPVQIGIEITANARIENWKYQKEIGFEYVKATDTDSFHIPLSRLHHVEKFLDEKEIGKLKIEHTGYEKITGLKNYEIKLGKDIYKKNKGINGKKLKGKNRYTSDIWHTLKSIDKTVTVDTIEKTLKPFKDPKMIYKKRGNKYIGKPKL